MTDLTCHPACVLREADHPGYMEYRCMDENMRALLFPGETPHEAGWCDSTRCGQCHDDEAVYDCESCGDVFEPNEGCLCDGHQRCASCLINCPECRSNMRDDMAAEGLR